MRKVLLLLILCSLGAGCVKKNNGSIYGIVAEYTTAEPLRAAGVSLFVGDNLLLKTVTYDDGHFEFNDLEAGIYELMVEMDGYDPLTETVLVEAGRTAKADIQMKVAALRLVVTTFSPLKKWHNNYYYWELEGRIRYPNRDISVYPLDYGFVFSFHSNPTLDDCDYCIKPDSVIENDVASIINYCGHTMGSVSTYPNEYHVRAYAINENGVYYGEDQTCHV